MAPVIQKYCQYLFVTSIALYEAWRILGVSTRSFSFRLKTSNQNVLQVQSLSTADLPPVANQVPTPLEPSSSSIVEVPIGNTTNVESETVVQSVKSSTKKKRSLIPTPVFVTSLSKSGTTSVHHFFRCGKYTSTHFKNKKGKIGSCVASNVRKGRLPFEECGHYKVWADATDITRNHCYHVAVNDLEPVIAAYAPNMTVILSIRNPNSWLRSVKNWDRIPGKKRTPKLWDRLQTCERGSKFPNRFDLGRNITDQDFLDFYQWHADYVRRVAAQYQVKFVEVNIEDDRAGEILSNSTGIKSTCWGQYNVGHYSGQNTTHQKLINDESPSN